jgi:hypothetical protein
MAMSSISVVSNSLRQHMYQHMCKSREETKRNNHAKPACE